MLKLKNIKYKYNDSGNSFCIDIDSNTFWTARITCVLGKNGSGKTTFLNLLGGHLKCDSGEIILFDKNITELKAELRPTSTVFQQIGLFPHLSVKENIEIAIEPNTIFKKSEWTKKKAENILSDFNLTELKNRKPLHLSVGQQQRVAIARALSTSPKVLLLDEPTSALDFDNIISLKKMLKEIKDERKAPIIIIVSHDLPFVLDIADEIRYIESGKIVFAGTTSEFKQSTYHIN